MSIKTLSKYLFFLSYIFVFSAQAAEIRNMSTKSFVGRDDQRQVAGFVVTGSGVVRVAIKVEAPSLQNIDDLLDDPKLTLRNALTGEVIAVNDNWADDNSELLIAENAAPKHDLESAMIVDLPAGQWTALVEGIGGATGMALVSVKLLPVEEPEADLLNLSTKSFVGLNDQRQVAGLIIDGPGTVPVLIKATAPSLKNVQGLLADPQLTLKNAITGEIIKTNNDWQSGESFPAVTETGSAPSHSKEAAMVVDLPAGRWTALVEGATGETGVALVSIKKLSIKIIHRNYPPILPE